MIVLLSDRLGSSGSILLRYGLALILVWFGALKFTAYEAEAIAPLVSNSPLTAWAFHLLGAQWLSALLGVGEIVMGLLIVSRPFWPMASAIGSLGAVGVFLVTLSFIFSTPGVWQAGYGFPVPSPAGGFLAKDILLLGAACWSAGEAIRAARPKA